MTAERKLEVGDRVYTTNGGLYRRGAQPSIVVHEVTKVGRKFYTLGHGHNAYKVPIVPERGDKPGTRYYSGGYGGGIMFYFDRQAAEDVLWISVNKYRLEAAVVACRDAAVLKRVAAVFDAPPIPDGGYTCHICFGKMVERRNRHTGLAFWGCANWPSCHGAKNLDGSIGRTVPRPPGPGYTEDDHDDPWLDIDPF